MAAEQKEKKVEHLRGLDFYNPEEHQNRHVALVGLGGVGSFAALGLAKLGVPMTVIDFDEVEPHNIPNQFYAHTQVGMNKADATVALCGLFGDVQIEPVQGNVLLATESELADVVVTGLDSMAVRNELWEKNICRHRVVNLLIDARLLGQYITLYCINPNDEDHIAYYEHNCMYSDEEAETAVCTARAIIDVGEFVGALVTRAVRKYLTTGSVEHTIVLNVDTMAITKGDEIEVGYRDRVKK